MHCHVHNRKFSPGIVISSCCSPVADEAALAAAEAEVAAADAAAEAEAAALCTEPIIKVITWRIPRNRQFA